MSKGKNSALDGLSREELLELLKEVEAEIGRPAG